jgi:hypothetical protein
MMDFMRQVWNLVLEMAFTLADDDPFWAGFFAAFISGAALWVGMAVFGSVYRSWLKNVRPFFDKPKLAGETPIKLGKSPFEAATGCCAGMVLGVGALLLGFVGLLALLGVRLADLLP